MKYFVSNKMNCVYKMENKTLMYQPLTTSGMFYPDDEWTEVDFDRIDVELKRHILVYILPLFIET